MSYILDALRRADAERQQGAVPGLHAAPTPGAAPAARGAWRWWVVAVFAGGLGLAAALAWFWRAPAPPAVAPQPSAMPAVPATVPMPMPMPMPVPAPAPASASAPGLPVVVSAAPSPPLPEATRPAPPEAPASAAAARPLPPSLPLNLPLSSLPPEERRQLPPLVAGGSVWSDSAASRFVILDGQVLREGDAVAPGLVLERIERKAAVLRWKNQRVELPL